jgi:hypothetical protein
MATQITCKNVVAALHPISYGRNLWFLLAITDNGVTEEQWNAASPTERLRWLQVAYDQRVAKCSDADVSKANKELLRKTLVSFSTRTYPKNPLGAIAKAIKKIGSQIVRRIPGVGDAYEAVEYGVNALSNKSDTPRPLYVPASTGSAGPSNPNARTSGGASAGGISPLLLIGGAVVAGVVLFYAIKKGAR